MYRKRNIVYIGFSTVRGLRHPPRVLEHTPWMQADGCIYRRSLVVAEIVMLSRNWQFLNFKKGGP